MGYDELSLKYKCVSVKYDIYLAIIDASTSLIIPASFAIIFVTKLGVGRTWLTKFVVVEKQHRLSATSRLTPWNSNILQNCRRKFDYQCYLIEKWLNRELTFG